MYHVTTMNTHRIVLWFGQEHIMRVTVRKVGAESPTHFIELHMMDVLLKLEPVR